MSLSISALLLLAAASPSPAPADTTRRLMPVDSGSITVTAPSAPDSLTAGTAMGPAIPPTATVSTEADGPRLTAARTGLSRFPLVTDTGAAAADTGRRRVSVEYSDWYGRRTTIHRWLSFAMLPLFAASYASGDQILRADRRSDAPAWARDLHPIAAGATAGVFGLNTITGLWNLWDSRRDPEGRTKRWLHAGAFMLANAGFVYAGSLGDEAREDGDVRNRHRAVALGSMGLSTASWLFMLITNR